MSSRKDRDDAPIPIKIWLVLLLMVAAVIGCVFLVTGCQSILGPNYPADNPIEELAEEAIDHYTGFDVDLSPCTEEV